MLQAVLSAYGFNRETTLIESFGSGLINHTWKVTAANHVYILQKINTAVFKKPASIAANIKLVADFLQQQHPEYYFVSPLLTQEGSTMIEIEGEGFFRMFPFVPGSFSKDVVETPGQAFEAAAQFGRFTKLGSGLDVQKLQITIPAFHDLSLRYRQFLMAIENGNQQKVQEAAELIEEIKKNVSILHEYEAIKLNPEFKLRVTHHDTKISNVLFNGDDKALCVIDLDTLMPGYFISDVGDMMRTYLSPVSEEETDFSKIEVRDDFYKAVVEGYYQQMKNELSDTEKKYFFYSGTFMIYMQAIRFLTDFMKDDIYYGAKYPGHNLARAKNQMQLLQCMQEKKKYYEEFLNTLS
jgi:Ser/Thr protein kinase RdoA (MazF antagonist)